MDFTPSLDVKRFYRFTGPPENWLTAIKHMTWGMQESNRKKWEKLETGDVFFIHSTGPATSRFANAQSSIIGFGVIGSNFRTKDMPLWLAEQEKNTNDWPLLIPISEFYLFGSLPPSENWESPNLENNQQTKKLIDQLVYNAVPLRDVPHFPHMGSFSSVGLDVAQQLLNEDNRPLSVSRDNSPLSQKNEKFIPLEKINKATETLRHADSLQIFKSIKPRIVKSDQSIFAKDNELLARAELVHGTILQNLIDIFQNRGYETYGGKYVDLYAHNNKKSFLFEVKSTENNNFQSQARKAIVQILEYDHFDIIKFKTDNHLVFEEQNRIIVPSHVPKDMDYVAFINSLRIGVGVVEGDSLVPVGKDFGWNIM